MAADDVRRIRAIWKLHYNAKNRRKDEGPSAEAVAAERWDLGADGVENILTFMK